jgi:hypothetical protein
MRIRRVRGKAKALVLVGLLVGLGLAVKQVRAARGGRRGGFPCLDGTRRLKPKRGDLI